MNNLVIFDWDTTPSSKFFATLPNYDFLDYLTLSSSNSTYPTQLDTKDVSYHLNCMEDYGDFYPIICRQRDIRGKVGQEYNNNEIRADSWSLVTRKNVINHIKSPTFYKSLPYDSLSLDSDLNHDLEEVVFIMIIDSFLLNKCEYLMFRLVQERRGQSSHQNNLIVDCDSHYNTLKLDEFALHFSDEIKFLGTRHRSEKISCPVAYEGEEKIKEWLVAKVEKQFDRILFFTNRG